MPFYVINAGGLVNVYGFDPAPHRLAARVADSHAANPAFGAAADRIRIEQQQVGMLADK